MNAEGAGGAEYIRGVRHPLPAGEHVLWEGAPDPGALATHVFHRRWVIGYFLALIAWWISSTTVAAAGATFAAGFGVRIALATVVLIVVEVLARVSARTAWYAITNRRVVLKIGMVIEMSINIPFSIIESADVGRFKDGTGQLLLTLTKPNRLAYIALWPHCRALSVNHPQPMLCGLRDAPRVGALLAAAVAEAAARDNSSPVERSTARDARPDTGAVRQPVGV